MGIESYRWGWTKSNIQPITKLVLIALCSFAKDCGCCYPSTRLISKQTGLAQRTVQHHIKYLTEQGFVERTKRGKGRTSSGFRVLMTGDFGITCSASGCGAKTSSGASSISISKDIDINNYNKELDIPEWLKIIDLTTEVGLVQNANHPSVKDYIDETEKDFIDVDLLAEAKKYHLWWEGKKAKKPKLAFRNWLEKAKINNAKSIQRASKGTSTSVSDIIDARTRQIAEQQERLRK